jgi:hypothetical protein
MVLEVRNLLTYYLGMKIFVLGAGASFHAGYPLASTMGAALEEWTNSNSEAASYQSTLSEIRQRYGNLDDFESILEDLMTPRAEHKSSFEIQRPYLLSNLQEALRLQFEAIRSHPAALYDRLAEVTAAGDVIITFNYDLAVERSLRRSGKWSVRDGYGFDLGTPEQRSSVQVLKLHGSMNWRALLFGGKTRGGFISHGDSLGHRPVLFFKPDHEYLGYEGFVDPLCANMTSAPVLPALILPGLPKRFYFETSFGREWTDFWDSIWRQAADSLCTADEVVIIGYSLPVADIAARELLLNPSRRKGSTRICCGRSTKEICSEFHNRGFVDLLCDTPTFEDYLSL